MRGNEFFEIYAKWLRKVDIDLTWFICNGVPDASADYDTGKREFDLKRLHKLQAEVQKERRVIDAKIGETNKSLNISVDDEG